MLYFCNLVIYLRLDNIRQGIYKYMYASLKKYCIWWYILVTLHEILPSHFPPFYAFLHQTYYLWLVSNRWMQGEQRDVEFMSMTLHIKCHFTPFRDKQNSIKLKNLFIIIYMFIILGDPLPLIIQKNNVPKRKWSLMMP